MRPIVKLGGVVFCVSYHNEREKRIDHLLRDALLGDTVERVYAEEAAVVEVGNQLKPKMAHSLEETHQWKVDQILVYNN